MIPFTSDVLVPFSARDVYRILCLSLHCSLVSQESTQFIMLVCMVRSYAKIKIISGLLSEGLFLVSEIISKLWLVNRITEDTVL